MDFVKENAQNLNGKCFLIVSAGPSDESEASSICHVNVVGSPMSMEIMRAMIIAAVYHHNIQDDSLDIALVNRDDGGTFTSKDYDDE